MSHEEPGLLHLVESEEWEHLLLACWPAGETAPGADQASARNQAVLWVLAQTGMRTSEVCELRLSDVDRDHGLLRIRGKGSRVRWVPLGEEGRHHLSVYLDRYRLPAGQNLKRRRATLAHIQPGEQVLDVGCGTGTLAMDVACPRRPCGPRGRR
ncbi:tyrosine-type recombinase/integrase [Dictyobacter vulcani]|uniref:tyrosine-type recombinase/integrase n=1 Tax=Dictyobacter vulcani TaxID=2607529 RepID=UPI001250CD1F|nr:tyrosine-type recombinase/integrase [Dictyobacter vulcani]